MFFTIPLQTGDIMVHTIYILLVLCTIQVSGLHIDNFKKYAIPLNLQKNTTSKLCARDYELFLSAIDKGDQWAHQSK